MPIVAARSPIFARPPINYVPRPTRRAFLSAALATPAAVRFIVLPGGRRIGLGQTCVLGQPSTDPNCFTTPAYIRALNLAQVAAEQKSGLLPTTGPGGTSASCYDEFMSPANFQPDAYNKCIGAQDVTSAAFDAAAAAGVPFASNPYQTVVPVAPPAGSSPTPPPAKPPAQSNAPAPQKIGDGAAQSNAPAASTVAPSGFDQLASMVTASSFDGIPNWALVVGGLGVAWFAFGRKR